MINFVNKKQLFKIEHSKKIDELNKFLNKFNKFTKTTLNETTINDYKMIINAIEKLVVDGKYKIYCPIESSAFDIKKFKYCFNSYFSLVYLCLAYGEKNHLFLSSSNVNTKAAIPIQVMFHYMASRENPVRRNIVDFGNDLFNFFEDKMKDKKMKVEWEFYDPIMITIEKYKSKK